MNEIQLSKDNKQLNSFAILIGMATFDEENWMLKSRTQPNEARQGQVWPRQSKECTPPPPLFWNIISHSGSADLLLVPPIPSSSPCPAVPGFIVPWRHFMTGTAAFSMGQVIGPGVGGILSEPATYHPGTFSESGIFGR